MVLFIVGENTKKIYKCKPEMYLIWQGYVLFGLHNAISTYKVPYLLYWNVLHIAQCLKYFMTIRGVWMRVFTDNICGCNLISRGMPYIRCWSLKANLKQQETCNPFKQVKCIGFY